MKINRLKIHNWRSIKDIDIKFQDLMVFIGQNNHGKSNILSGLLFFFGLISCGDLDFNQGGDELYVEITFSDLDSHDKTQFTKYLTSANEFTVRKQIKKNESYEYHGYTQSPSEEWLKEANVSNYLSRDAIAATPLNQLVPTAGRLTKDIVYQAQQKYINDNKDLLVFSYELESSNFLGLKNVAQGIFGDVFYVPAVKNAIDEFSVKGKSVFNQLLTNVINDMSETNESYIEVKNQVRALTQRLNKTVADGSVNTNRPEQICKLEQLLESELASWHTTIDIQITPPDVDEVMRVGTNVWVDDGISTDVNHKGNGLQRSLIFALIKSWAKVSQEQKENEELAQEEDGQRKASKSTYFIFEEPELYLHPQAQRELYSSLKNLSETNSQVFISTHSSSFIDLEMYKSVCIVYKDNITEGTKHLQCTSDIFDSVIDKQKFNLTYWINPDRGELFFAKKVVLVEGQTDKTVFSYLARKLGCFRYDYTIIDCGSKDNIPLYIHLLNNFKLPYIAVYDKDHQSYKDANGIASADISTQCITSKVDQFYGSSIVLENDIEEEIGITDKNNKNKPHIAIEHISIDTFQISTQFESKIRSIFA
ncbi:MAG: AAA family ATPase [Candidatus Shapirobacteria bacterium]|nr:AAA family ATPase [Candidatus Shapirobacteria bacterium]